MSAVDCLQADWTGSHRPVATAEGTSSRQQRHRPGDCCHRAHGHCRTPAPMAGSLRIGGPCPGRPRVPPARARLSPAGAAVGRIEQAGKAAAQGAGAKTGIEGRRASSSPATVKPGTRFLREWQGEMHEVQAIETGDFIYRGRTYRSLSVVAREITGTHQSGPRFFGLGRYAVKRSTKVMADD